MKGLYINDTIVEIAEREFEVHENLKWIDVSEDCAIGWKVENGSVIRPLEKTAQEKLNELRRMRDIKLRRTDWVSGEDIPQSLKDLWFPYRQTLRDITQTYQSIDEVIWPTKPE